MGQRLHTSQRKRHDSSEDAGMRFDFDAVLLPASAPTLTPEVGAVIATTSVAAPANVWVTTPNEPSVVHGTDTATSKSIAAANATVTHTKADTSTPKSIIPLIYGMTASRANPIITRSLNLSISPKLNPTIIKPMNDSSSQIFISMTTSSHLSGSVSITTTGCARLLEIVVYISIIISIFC